MGRSPSEAVSARLTWCDGNAVAVDDGAFLLLLLGRLDALLLHVADRFVPLALPLGAGAGSGQQLVGHIKEHGRGLGRGLGRAIEVVCRTGMHTHTRRGSEAETTGSFFRQC